MKMRQTQKRSLHSNTRTKKPATAATVTTTTTRSSSSSILNRIPRNNAISSFHGQQQHKQQQHLYTRHFGSRRSSDVTDDPVTTIGTHDNDTDLEYINNVDLFFDNNNNNDHYTTKNKSKKTKNIINHQNDDDDDDDNDYISSSSKRNKDSNDNKLSLQILDGDDHRKLRHNQRRTRDNITHGGKHLSVDDMASARTYQSAKNTLHKFNQRGDDDDNPVRFHNDDGDNNNNDDDTTTNISIRSSLSSSDDTIPSFYDIVEADNILLGKPVRMSVDVGMSEHLYDPRNLNSHVHVTTRSDNMRKQIDQLRQQYTKNNDGDVEADSSTTTTTAAANTNDHDLIDQLDFMDDGERPHDTNKNSNTQLATVKESKVPSSAIIDLYLSHYNKYDMYDTNELSNTLHIPHKQRIKLLKDDLVTTLITNLDANQYNQLVLSFRTLVLHLRSLLKNKIERIDKIQASTIKHTSVVGGYHNTTDDSIRRTLHEFNTSTTRAKQRFLSSMLKIMGPQSDVLLPQLVSLMGHLTLADLESSRERRRSSKMNPYTAGFLRPDTIKDCEQQYVSKIGTPLVDGHFTTSFAAKLYEQLDIYTDITSPLLWSQLDRVNQTSHKVFIRNIPPSLTTRELMILCGPLGLLNGVEIYRETSREDPNDTSMIDSNSTNSNTDDTQSSLHLTTQEALINANMASLTSDVAHIQLSAFTSSFYDTKNNIPLHLIKSTTISPKEVLLLSSGASYIHEHGIESAPINTQNYTSANIRATSHNNNNNNTIQHNNNNTDNATLAATHEEIDRHFDYALTSTPRLRQATIAAQASHNLRIDPNNPLGSMIRPPLEQSTPIKSSSSKQNKINGIDKNLVSERFTPRPIRNSIYGTLYFATAEGKDRALSHALRIFGIATQAGMNITTMEPPSRLHINGLPRHYKSIDIQSLLYTLLDHSKYIVGKENGINVTNIHVPAVNRQNDHVWNRGHAVMTFNTHDDALSAFKILNGATVKNTIKAVQQDNRFDDSSTNASALQDRVLRVQWNVARQRKQPKPHPITSYFPTQHRPKTRMYRHRTLVRSPDAPASHQQ